MSGAIGHWGRRARLGIAIAVLWRPVMGLATAVSSRRRPIRRERSKLPAVVGFAIAVLCRAVVGLAIAAPAASTWSLLPQPAHARITGSRLVTVAEGALVGVRAADRQQVQPIADRFIQLVANTRGLQLHPTTGARSLITFEVDPRADVEGDTGYRIVVGPEGIRVTARSAGGAFYGSVTLWQLLTQPVWRRGTAAEITEGVIDDHPRFVWRALLLDSGRHFQSVADIKKLIDWMSLEKLNVLLWHLTEDQGWRLEIPKYPELTKTGACRKAVGLDIELTGAAGKPYCGSYTEVEVRDIVRYAAARFVTVVPGIDLPGALAGGRGRLSVAWRHRRTPRGVDGLGDQSLVAETR
jgi:hexosaminidase